MSHPKIFVSAVFLLFMAGIVSAQTPTVTLSTVHEPIPHRVGEVNEITIATWDTFDWTFLNNYDMELWLFVPPQCAVDGPCHNRRLIRWQTTPAGRGVMVIDGSRMVDRSMLRFKLRDVVAGGTIDLETE